MIDIDYRYLIIDKLTKFAIR